MSQRRPSQRRPSQRRPNQHRPSQRRPSHNRQSQRRPSQHRPNQRRPNQRSPSHPCTYNTAIYTHTPRTRPAQKTVKSGQFLSRPGPAHLGRRVAHKLRLRPAGDGGDGGGCAEAGGCGDGSCGGIGAEQREAAALLRQLRVASSGLSLQGYSDWQKGPGSRHCGGLGCHVGRLGLSQVGCSDCIMALRLAAQYTTELAALTPWRATELQNEH